MPVSLLIALGGGLGSLARYWVGVWAAPLSRSVPWGTVGINVAGSFLIGFFGTLTLEGGRYPAPEWARLFVMVGVCGGFTTFSSFSLQNFDLMRSGAWGRMLVNVGVSVVMCLGAVALGHVAAAGLNGGVTQVAQTVTEEEA